MAGAAALEHCATLMRRFGLVLGAGGGTGRAFHAGVLAALHEVACVDARDAALIVGTSAGSLDGAFLRAGVAPLDMFARVTERSVSTAAEALYERQPLWVDPDEEGVAGRWRPASAARLRAAARRPWQVTPHTMGTLFAAAMREGRRPTRLIDQMVTALHPHAWPSRRFWVCTVRLDDGRRVVFGRDEGATATVGQAVAASCAIPGYFAPVVIGGERYVDGGAHSPSNLDLVARLGLDLVIVSSPMTASPRALRLTPDGVFRAACRFLLRRELAALRRHGVRVALFEPSAEDLVVMGSVADSMSAHKPARVATQAYGTTARSLRAGPLSDVLQTALA